MKPEQMYALLKELAEKINVTVSEQSFKNTGIPVRSGLCKVREDTLFIMDRNLPMKKKVTVLAIGLKPLLNEDMYLVPAVRQLFSVLSKD